MKTSATHSLSPRGQSAATSLGRKLRAARQARGYSQPDLAVRARISMSTLVRMEAGDAGTAVGMWINAFEVLGLLGVFTDAADPVTENVARAALDRPIRKRKPSRNLDF